MTIKTVIDEALQKPMSRRDFLGQVGALLLAVLGVTSIMHSLSGSAGHGMGSAARANNSAADYGDTPYGA